MLKTIGIVLLLYGAAGVAGTFIVYGVLRAPMARLRELLKLLSEKMEVGSHAADQAGDWVRKASPILQKIANLLSFIVTLIRGVASGFGQAANTLKSVEALLDPVKVPILTFQSRTLNLDFSTPVVTSVHLKEYTIDVTPGISGGKYTLYGPPLTLGTAAVGLHLGQVPVITAINMSQTYPLQAVGDAFRVAGEIVEGAEQQIDQTGDRVEEMKERTLEARESVDKTAENLHDFADQLKQAGRDVVEMSENKMLSLIPALVLGYFGFIHAAFALTGLALLLM